MTAFLTEIQNMTATTNNKQRKIHPSQANALCRQKFQYKQLLQSISQRTRKFIRKNFFLGSLQKERQHYTA